MKIKKNGKYYEIPKKITDQFEDHDRYIIGQLLLVVGIMGLCVAFALFLFSAVTAQAQETQFTKDDLGEPINAFFLGYDLDAMAEFTAKHEGFSECAYYDLGGGWSIGYGTVSHEGECITEAEARKRLKFVLQAASGIVHGYTGVIPQSHMTALADTIFNVRPRNYDYILRQYHHSERKRELTYALSRMTRACYKGECTVYRGLQRRFEARTNLLFN